MAYFLRLNNLEFLALIAVEIIPCDFQNLCLHDKGEGLWDALSVYFPGADKILKGAIPV